MKTILGIDIGTNTGVCYNCQPLMKHICETWKLATPKEITAFSRQRLNRRNDPRVLTFRKKLDQVPRPDIVVFEDVQFASSTYQVQLWAALRSVIWLTFPDRLIDCVPVATLKRFATGHGGATKEMMAQALKKQHSYMWSNDLDDNAVDAAWLWIWAKQNFARI